QYLATWLQYPMQVNKAMMDILRYGSATSYLKIPFIHDKYLDIMENTSLTDQGSDVALSSLGNSMVGFATGWTAIAKALKTSITETSELKVCLGFEKYEHSTKTISATDIDQTEFPKVVDALVKLAQVRDNDELKAFMLLVNLSS